jgi:hypothetical protein
MRLCSLRELTDESIKFPSHQLRGFKRWGSAAAAKSAPSTRSNREGRFTAIISCAYCPILSHKVTLCPTRTKQLGGC